MSRIDFVRVVRIEQWPADVELEGRSHPFRETVEGKYRRYTRHGVNWTDTVEMLRRELDHLEAENVLLQMAVSEHQLRNDGWIRADTRPDHPGVILTFDSKFGPLSYPAGAFDDWQANIRAIAVSLENLRRVDRYGVSGRGQQYTGWKRLPGPGQTHTTMTAQIAAELLVDVEDRDGSPSLVLGDPETFRLTYRAAAKKAHPDAHGGDTKRFQLIQEAKRVLEAHHA